MKSHGVVADPTRAGRYLADQLDQSERAEFEALILEDPHTVAELEATARLKIGLDRLRRDGELSDLLETNGTPHPGRAPMWALAAGIAAIAIGASLWIPRATLSPSPMLGAAAGVFKDRNGHDLPILATAPLFRTRAERYDAVIELPPTRGTVKLRILPSLPTSSARYVASLARMRDDDSSENVVQIGGLRASQEDGFVDVYADSSLLQPGRYRLTLTAEAAGSAASTPGTGVEIDTFVIKVNRHD
jgi:hypothetical protein